MAVDEFVKPESGDAVRSVIFEVPDMSNPG
jgi:hypothetical protein